MNPMSKSPMNDPTAPVVPHDREERLIWRILGRLESLALRKYETVVPPLATPDKKVVVEQLLTAAPDDSELNKTDLGPRVDGLLDAAVSHDHADTLLVHGLVLERLGQVIYRMLGAHPSVSHATRSLAEMGTRACARAADHASELTRQAIGEGEIIFERFCIAADSVLRRLDGLGSGVDEYFGERFGLTFSELLGEFTAELLPACVKLGMNRRKVVCHLASVFMGG
jgi:hypothetical protein